MAVTTYRTHNGRVRGESTGGVPATYLTDALGSVTATVDAGASVVSTYRAKPSGQRLAKTGSGTDPAYEYTGDTGSRRTGLAYAEQSNRRRHLGTRQGNWTSVDPLWPYESAYGYVRGNPTTFVDPSGLIKYGPGCEGLASEMDSCCKSLHDMFNDPKGSFVADLLQCMESTHQPVTPDFLFTAVQYIMNACSNKGRLGQSPSKKQNPKGPEDVCVFCMPQASQTMSGNPPGLPDVCTAGGKAHFCRQTPEAPFDMYAGTPWQQSVIPPQPGCRPNQTKPYRSSCDDALHDLGCAAVTFYCRDSPYGDSRCGVLFHELVHAGGAGDHASDNARDPVYALGCCLCRLVNGPNKCKGLCSGYFK